MSFIAKSAPSGYCDEVASGTCPQVQRTTAAGDTFFRALAELSALEHKSLRMQGTFLAHAINAASQRKAEGLRLSLALIRTASRDMTKRISELESLLGPSVDEQMDADIAAIQSGDLDAATEVYGSEK